MSLWLLVLNLRSRRGTRLLPRALARAARGSLPAGVEVRTVGVSELDRIREATEGRPDRLIVLGGDGTANAAASWIIARGLHSPIAVVPAGTGDNLARDLGIPLDPERALDLALGGPGSHGAETRSVDAIAYEGSFGRRVFVQMAALGFPADVVERYQVYRQSRFLGPFLLPLGTRLYKAIALWRLTGAKRRERRGEGVLELRLDLPGETIEGRAVALFLGNGPSTGGNFMPCPEALPDDGILDLCVVRAGTGAGYFRLFRAFAEGRHIDRRDAVIYRRAHGPLSISLARPSPFLADGDLLVRGDRFRLEILPRRLRFLVPPCFPEPNHGEARG